MEPISQTMQIPKLTIEARMAVEAAVTNLRQLSGLCFMLTRLQDRDDATDLEDIGGAMALIYKTMDAEIKALDTIQWPK